MPSAEPEKPTTTPAVEEVDAGAKDKAPERPNRDALDKQLKELDAKIDEQKKIMDDVKERLDKIKAEQSKDGGKKNEGQSKLQELRAVTRAVSDERKQLFDQQKANKEENKKARDKFDEMRKSLKDLGVYSTEDVDKKIRDLEYYLATNPLSLKEEKVVIADIKSLSGSKKILAEFDAVKAKKEKCDATAKEISAKLDATKPALDAAKKAEDAQYKLVSDARDKNNNRDEWKIQQDRRTDAKKCLDKLYGEIKKLRDEYRVKDQAYQVWVKARRAEAKERARKEAEERKEEIKLRKLQQAEEEADTLHGDEVALCEQLTGYLQTKKSVDTVKEDAKPEPVAAEDAGERIDKKSKAMDDDVFGTKKAGKKITKKGKGKKKAGMVHDLEVMVSFEKLKIDAPLAAEAIDGTIQKLAEKKTALLKDREVQREKRKAEMAKVEAEIAEKEKNKPADADDSAKESKAESKKDEAAAETKVEQPAAVEASA